MHQKRKPLEDRCTFPLQAKAAEVCWPSFILPASVFCSFICSVCPFAACPALTFPDCLCEVQQAQRGEQQVPELRERPHAAALSAGHFVIPDPSTPHPIPAVSGTDQRTAELLQTRHSGEGSSHRRSASTDHKCPGNPAPAAQR